MNANEKKKKKSTPMPPASIYYCLNLLFSGSDELISPFLFSVLRDSLSALE